MTRIIKRARSTYILDEHELHEFLDKHRILLYERTRIARITRMIKEPGLENEHESHELHELFKERRLEDDTIFFQSL